MGDMGTDVNRYDRDDYPLIHGDPGHSCYDEDGELTCVVGKMLGFGPSWRELMEASE